ncbi:DUF342 domain-containing protein [Vibrio sp. CAIM 722]|uniref:DUF342 domain-containing protein n=1 Tax=Vibrio eleionomae TaxID=2653505 RepID=A0A7X4LNX5_9VIBR|nr:FapA family protein [Vibrio eleionomae]MZI95270.1 DUF342 domain-containing protein [Vibrio eleionomae]
MWKDFVVLNSDKSQVIAKISEGQKFDANADVALLPTVLAEIGAKDFKVLDKELSRFIEKAKLSNSEAAAGIVIAEKHDAAVTISVDSKGMVATMVVTGAFGGSGLHANQMVQELSHANIKKGINKQALKKVLVASESLTPGQTFSQVVAHGKPAENGENSKLVPLVADVMKRVLAPKDNDAIKIDMRDFGQTVTVSENDPVMKREPATKGKSGFTVFGEILKPKPGQVQALKAGKGTHLSDENPNLLLASQPGMPIIRGQTVDVETAMCLNSVSVATGHVKFKGSVVVAGDVEPGMIIRATGNVIVGGFIESADVQAQGDIEVGKGIIGHTVSEDEPKSCIVKSGGNIKANYAQFSEIQASHNISLVVHSMSNHIRCGGDLLVIDENETQGTLSGGKAKVGGKVLCFNLGVEGDTATYVEGFARYSHQKERILKHKALYKEAQEKTMDAVRREISVKKKDKSQRTKEDVMRVEKMKQSAQAKMEKAKLAVELAQKDFEEILNINTIEAKGKVFTHVTVMFADARVTTKRVHGPSTFHFNQYEILCAAKLDDESVKDVEI